MDRAIETRSISSEAAQAALAAGLAEAASIGKSFVIAITDAAGELKTMHRMDGAPYMSIQVAVDKAYTAGSFGRSTAAWDDAVENDGPLARGARSGIDRLVTFGGGIAIKDGGILGGVGVSGGHYSEDIQVAEAAIRALGLDPS
jgi:uncharacterized protein GlcG (DUF336 family)